MTDILNYKTKSIADLLPDIQKYKNNPSRMQRAILDYLEDASYGQINIVDPSNPFVFLLESSATMAAAGIVENGLNTRKTYACLAQTESDLYPHMSDKDFIDRFAVPCQLPIYMLFQMDSLLNAMIDSPSEYCRKVKIPRNTRFVVNAITYSLQYPIEIREYYNGMISVNYIKDKESPLQDLETNIIPHVIRREASGASYLSFTITLMQFDIITSYFAIHSSEHFKQTLTFPDKYYHLRIYHKSGTSTEWVELKTTHTDQVFDVLVPTACLKVYDNVVEVVIPPVYINSGLLSGNIRIDVYYTQGYLDINYGQYTLDQFSYDLKAIDEENDTDLFTAAMYNVSFRVFSQDTTIGGRDKLAFEKLRERVINNSVGPRNLPITNVNISDFADDLGYTLVSNIDTVTNRIFLANKALPASSNRELITPANLTYSTLVTTQESLMSNADLFINKDRVTIPSKNLYQLINGKLNFFSKLDLTELKKLPATQLADAINAGGYMYSPFYYVLDSTGIEYDVRVYHLDSPKITALGFEEQNTSLGLQVSTANYLIEKQDGGYRIVVSTLSDSVYQELDDKYVQCQLGLYPEDRSAMCYINGTLLGKTDSGERIFEFILMTNHDIDSNDCININNAYLRGDEQTDIYVELGNTFSIFYTTNSRTPDYKVSAIDTKIAKNMLPTNAAGITEESLSLSLGSRLNNLWTNIRSSSTEGAYQYYTEDVYEVYPEDVYESDPFTGSIFTINDDCQLVYNKTASKGDFVLDTLGNKIVKHYAGDAITDADGLPTPLTENQILRQIDILLVDGSYYFATGELFQNYRSSIANTITYWVTTELETFNDRKLEQTKIYYYSKKALGSINVKTSTGTIVSIESRQDMVVDLYVPSTVFKNAALRTQIERSCTLLLDTHLRKPVVSISEIVSTIKKELGSSIDSIRVYGLGGTDNNYEMVTLVRLDNRLSLGKVIKAQADNSLIVKEAITFNFIESSTA